MPVFALPPLYIAPSIPKVIPGGMISFTPAGGSGSGYSWTLTQNRSGGSVDFGSGLYTAGQQAFCTDVIQVTDGQGSTFTREIKIMGPDADTLGTVRQEVKERCDLVNSQFIVDAEWNRYINASYKALYEKLVDAYDCHYNVVEPPLQFRTDGVTQRYPLPIDFFKLLGVDVQISNTTSGWLPIPKFNFGERNRFLTPYQIFYGIRSNLHYRIVGDRIWIIPIAAGGQYIQLHYVPLISKLTLDTDVIDGVSGWEEWVKANVAVKALAKREQDTSVQQAIQQELDQRIQTIKEDRDAGSPQTVVDVRSQEQDFIWGRNQ